MFIKKIVLLVLITFFPPLIGQPLSFEEIYSDHPYLKEMCREAFMEFQIGNFGKCYQKIGEVLKYFKNEIPHDHPQRDEHLSGLYTQRARCLMHSNVFHLALSSCDKAIHWGDNNGNAHYVKAHIYYKLGLHKIAREFIQLSACLGNENAIKESR